MELIVQLLLLPTKVTLSIINNKEVIRELIKTQNFMILNSLKKFINNKIFILLIRAFYV